MKLDKYISDLLYRYDLVIIPGFGGLIGRKKSAHIDRDTYIFSPPHKQISFNAQLQENDGLLANYIAEINGISYNEALQNINEQINNWFSILKNQKSVKLDKIGIFNQTDDDRIIFLPITTTNYLTEAYGLVGFLHRPAKLKAALIAENIQPAQKKYTNTKNHKKSVSYKSKDHTPIWKYAAALVIGLGILGGGVHFYKQPKNQQVTYQKATFVLQKDFPPVVIGQKSQTEAPAPETPQINKQQYFIISGAFRNKNNAEKKKQELLKAGYKADIIGQNKHQLWMVAFQGFEQKQEAIKKLKTIKKLQATAWLYHKKQ